jgi:LysR family transcriptional regulator, regulator for bpeEF and oprC
MSRRDIGGGRRDRRPALRIADVEAFVQVMRAGSINGAGRALSIGPSQVSKAMTRLERHVGVKLLARSTRGIDLSDDGRRLAPVLIELQARASELAAPAEQAEIVIAAPSFLWAALVRRLGGLLDETRVHAVETRSSTMTAFASQAFFDAALTVGEVRWPGSWVKTQVGTLRRALFATPAAAKRLGSHARREALRRSLFVGRLDTDRGRVVPSPDGAPLLDRERRFGHRAQTAAMALELAESSGQIVFAPALAARPFLARGSLVEVPVQGWNVRERVFVVCHQDRVDAKVQRALVAAARAALAGD